jgi:hypothetical protein
MTLFQRLWAHRASRFRLSVAIPFTLSLDRATLSAPVLLRQFGARNGMLLVTDYGMIRPHADRVAELGYGYSCLSEPSSPDEEDDDTALLDMLRDWGWSGEGTEPAWLRGAAG